MSLPPPPPGMDIMEDATGKVIASVVAPAALAVVAVILRVWARFVTKAPFKWDDWLIFIALALSSVVCGLNVGFAKYGMGKHIWNPDVNLAQIFKLLWVTEFTYGTAIPAIKMSVIMFYHRIFVGERFNYMLYFCSFLVIGWWIAIVVVSGVQCQPYSFFWRQLADPTAKGKCINTDAFFLGNGIAEAVTDFIILGAPIHMVWRLQMPFGQKLAVMGIFLLGAFVCIAGVLRCQAATVFTRNADISWNLGQGLQWSSIEPSLGIVSACLPTLRPLVRSLFPGMFSAPNTADRKPSEGDYSKSREFYRLNDRNKFHPRGDEVSLTNEIRKGAGTSSGDLDREEDPAAYSISVQRDISWTSTQVGKQVP